MIMRLYEAWERAIAKAGNEGNLLNFVVLVLALFTPVLLGIVVFAMILLSPFGLWVLAGLGVGALFWSAYLVARELGTGEDE